jgi:outer membrane protein assembly factor BamB
VAALTKKWATTLPVHNDLYASPAVAFGSAYVVGGGHVFAIDLTMRSVRWDVPIDTYGYSSPAWSAGTVYAISGKVVAIDASSGVVKWTGQTPGVSLGAVTVEGKRVFVSGNEGVAALDSRTGATLWEKALPLAFEASPAVANGVVYIATWEDPARLYALDAVTGSTLWSVPAGRGTDTSLTVRDGVVYLGALYGNVLSFNAATGEKRWQITLGGGVDSAPAFFAGTLFVGAGESRFYAIDAATGTVRWTAPTDAGSYSPAVVNGVVLTGSDSGTLYGFDTTTGATVWSFHTGGVIRSTPVVVDGRVYVAVARTRGLVGDQVLAFTLP